MSFYKDICGICPDKRWIEPGTEKSPQPRHAVTGMGVVGAAEAATLDADHQPVPVNFRGEAAQQRMLSRALDIIRELAPDAVEVDLETSDQDRYGFVLRGLRDAAGNELLPEWDDTGHPLAKLEEEVCDQINDLDWNGVVGEGYGGYVTISLLDRSVVASS